VVEIASHDLSDAVRLRAALLLGLAGDEFIDYRGVTGLRARS
jgi:hypothetical protein